MKLFLNCSVKSFKRFSYTNKTENNLFKNNLKDILPKKIYNEKIYDFYGTNS